MSHDLSLFLLSAAVSVWFWARFTYTDSWLTHPVVDFLFAGSFVLWMGLFGISRADTSTLSGLASLFLAVGFVVAGGYIVRVAVAGYFYTLERRH